MFWLAFAARKASRCCAAHCPLLEHRCAIPYRARGQGHAKHDPEKGEGIAESLYYSWSKEIPEAGKRRLSGDTARQATSPEVKDLRSESLASAYSLPLAEK